ncbi:MAG: hypothetical protein Q9227_003796 [Pyrenula ochraceoflavens]
MRLTLIRTATAIGAVWIAQEIAVSGGTPVQSRQTNNVGGTVQIKSGSVKGRASGLYPEVSEYLGIPFAQPPTGDLRFSAPVPAEASNGTTDATSFVAYISGAAGEKILKAFSQDGDTLDEDCLTLNVWTKPQSGEAKKAVLFWIYGGGFSTGNTACPIYNGANLANEQDVVVVSANYRLNIFGFSGAPGQNTNVGLLDQRLALEWTRDNIEAFGGDPSRITVFGQSAGGVSTDLIVYGYPDDPIAHAIIPESGTAGSGFVAGSSQQQVQSNWYKATKNAGCGGEEAGEATVACMRSKSTDEILAAIKPFQLTALQSGFGPFPDGKTFPNDISTRGQTGQFAKLPTFTGSTNNEAAFFVLVALAYTNVTAAQAYAIPTTLVQPIFDLFTFSRFTCPAYDAAQLRAQHNIPVWRYQYFGGNYSNTYVKPLGSNYHTSELPLVFGTAADVTGVPDSAVEAAMARVIRTAWAAFAKDPVNGLAAWPMAGNPFGTSPFISSLLYLANVFSPETSITLLSTYGAPSPTYATQSTEANLCPVAASVPDLADNLLSLLTQLSVIELSGSQAKPNQLQAIQKLLQVEQIDAYANATSMRSFISGLQDVQTLLNGGGGGM